MSIIPTPIRATPSTTEEFDVDPVAVLKALNLSPTDPKTHALMLVCKRYGLDPVLKHIVIVKESAYVTRDGYLTVAHRSGLFDGMEVLEQGETDTHFTAKVSVFRKDMGRPFTYVGRYPKTGPLGKTYGPEMAIKCSEVMALRRAFNVTGLPAADEQWDVAAQIDAGGPPRPAIETGSQRSGSLATPAAPPSDEFTADDEKLVSADVRRAWVAEMTEGGWDEKVQAAAVHRATKGRTSDIRRVEKAEWKRVGVVVDALIAGKLMEAVVDGDLRLVVTATGEPDHVAAAS